MNRLNLISGLVHRFPWREQEQIRVSQHGGESVVYIGPHVEHVTPQDRVVLRFQGQSFGAMRPPERLNAAKHFICEKDECVRPAFLPRQHQQIRILAAEARDSVLIFRHANDGFVFRIAERVEDGRVSAGNEFDDEKVIEEAKSLTLFALEFELKDCGHICFFVE